ncbi:leucine-rich colipase-like protein 1 isoform X1 [Eleutherodactylus coqui]|uniref:leucine-rich colipase-like protein 1 isoform X1 n=1 Tax=Eleutherodactylus coqui TaxID=57060 RepID=UPI0034632C68
MTQFRMMTILLFLCLSLGFNVAQSELKCMDSPCMNSTECMSSCCIRLSSKGFGKCVQNFHHLCHGPNDGDQCNYSEECNSGCCGGLGLPPICVQKHPKFGKCVGPNNGDYCYSSDDCNSGCCHRILYYGNFGQCGPKEENQECSGLATNIFDDYPIENGLI